jgi:hypothetical protein
MEWKLDGTREYKAPFAMVKKRGAGNARTSFATVNLSRA